MFWAGLYHVSARSRVIPAVEQIQTDHDESVESDIHDSVTVTAMKTAAPDRVTDIQSDVTIPISSLERLPSITMPPPAPRNMCCIYITTHVSVSCYES